MRSLSDTQRVPVVPAALGRLCHRGLSRRRPTRSEVRICNRLILVYSISSKEADPIGALSNAPFFHEWQNGLRCIPPWPLCLREAASLFLESSLGKQESGAIAAQIRRFPAGRVGASLSLASWVSHKISLHLHFRIIMLGHRYLAGQLGRFASH